MVGARDVDWCLAPGRKIWSSHGGKRRAERL